MCSYKIIALLAISLITTICFSQEHAIRVKYLLNFKIDSTNLENIDSEIMYLDILKTKSYFQSESTYLKDSILSSKNPQSLFGISKPKFVYNILKNGNEKYDVFYDYTAYKYKIIDSTDLKWNIINDSVKVILGQKCKLATTNFGGRKYNAWFSTEMNNSDGPYKFSGLPGIILELYDIRNHYHFKAFSIQKINKYNGYLKPEDYTKISKSQFIEFRKKIKEKPSLILYNPGIQIPKEGLDKYDRNHRERNKYKNNPIELTDE
jgi:GLPGLI family protein